MAKLGEVCKVSPSTKNIERQGAWLLNLDMVEQQTGRVIEYKYVGEDDLNGSIIQFDTENVLYSKLRPNLNKVVLPPKDGFSTSELLPLRPDASVLNKDYLAAFLRSDSFVTWAVSKTAGAKMPRLGTKDLMNAEIPVPSIEQQKKIAEKFKKLEQLISLRKQQLAKLDELVKARFVEMFGDFKNNSKNWPIVKFDELAKIDGNMTTDYEKYADYPHIGIDSIEKETGELKGYRTVKEDGVVSGKYIFTPQHIIYSKIRPNLNKVALPDFEGLCSADAYPILPNPKNCNRIFLALTMRSDYFLDYILQFSARTNLPKVNRKEIAGFSMPLPPLSLQNDFATFVERVSQQKQTIQQSLDKLELMKKALMQEYFG